MARSLNHNFYDSLIYSGKINFLDPSLQQPVQDIFKRIKMHNKYVDATLEMAERNGGRAPISAQVLPAGKRLEKGRKKNPRERRDLCGSALR